MWVYSRRTVDAIARYTQRFPDVVNFIGASDTRIPAFEMSDIFPTNTLWVEPQVWATPCCLTNRFPLCVHSEKYSELRTFLRDEVKGNRIVMDANASLLDTKGLLVVQDRLLPDASLPTSSPEDCDCIEIAPTDAFAVHCCDVEKHSYFAVLDVPIWYLNSLFLRRISECSKAFYDFRCH